MTREGGEDQHVHPVRCRQAAEPFSFAAQLSQRGGGDRGCRGRAQPVRGTPRRGRFRRCAQGQRPAGPALRHSRRFGDVDGSEGGRLRRGRRAGRGQEDPRRRTEPARGRRGGDRRARPHRHAGLHRYAPPPVRDRAAQLPRRRGTHQRRVGLAEREHDLSQIHHSPQHSDAAIQALFDTGRRAAFGYFESAGAAIIGSNPGNQYPTDAIRIKKQWFSSTDQLVTMIMGGEVYLPGYEKAWKIGRQLGLQVAAHILSPFSIRPTLDLLAQGKGGDSGTLGLGPDNLFIHMTGMSDMGWQAVKNAGAQVSIAFPIEMNMRHGIPPIIKMQSLGMEPSLSVDVECTMTADFFTQMRVCMNMQRMVVNQMILEQGNFLPPQQWPTPAPGTPPLLTTRDVLRYGTMNGAKGLRLDGKVGSLTPGKEADILILDATRINVAPLNQVPGAVVSLMDRTNVETVIVAGKVRKWKGHLLDVDLDHLRQQLEASRDFVFAAAGIPQDLFRSN